MEPLYGMQMPLLHINPHQEEWRKAWKDSRSSEFFTLGSKDENGGNQTCTATLNEDGSLSLRLRLPPILELKYGKYLKKE